MGWKRECGICILIFEMAFALWVLIGQICFCADNWVNDYKAQAYASFFDYFVSVSKGAVLISAAFALVSAFLSIPLCQTKRKA